MLHSNELVILDIVKGLRHAIHDKDTAYRDAFYVYACRVMHGVLRIESMIEDYLETMAEAAEK